MRAARPAAAPLGADGGRVESWSNAGEQLPSLYLTAPADLPVVRSEPLADSDVDAESEKSELWRGRQTLSLSSRASTSKPPPPPPPPPSSPPPLPQQGIPYLPSDEEGLWETRTGMSRSSRRVLEVEVAPAEAGGRRGVALKVAQRYRNWTSDAEGTGLTP
jgi:hypothetical protein